MSGDENRISWHSLNAFHAAAGTGTLRLAGEKLGLSQSAVSRQISSLESMLSVLLFRRQAHGLTLTDPGKLLYRTVHEVLLRLEATRTKLNDNSECPSGELKVAMAPELGAHWLTPRLVDFCDLYPDVRITLITTYAELDIASREADVAICFGLPMQSNLVQRKLFSVRFHAYASPDYLKRFGRPYSRDDLEHHRLLFLDSNAPHFLRQRNYVAGDGSSEGKGLHFSHFVTNDVLGLLRACQSGLGIAILPDYMITKDSGIVQLFGEDTFDLDAYLVYSPELASMPSVQVFCDFLLLSSIVSEK